eukprot:2570429-Pyramimonas_sp.AAC.1
MHVETNPAVKLTKNENEGTVAALLPFLDVFPIGSEQRAASAMNRRCIGDVGAETTGLHIEPHSMVLKTHIAKDRIRSVRRRWCNDGRHRPNG